MTTATDTTIPEGFHSLGFYTKIEYTDFNSWYGNSGGIQQRTEQVNITRNENGTYSLDSDLTGPGRMYSDEGDGPFISDETEFATLADVKVALDEFIAKCPAAAQAEHDRREFNAKRDDRFDAALLAWLDEQYANVEMVTVGSLKTERPVAVIGDYHRIEELRAERAEYTNGEFDTQRRYQLDRSLWDGQGEYGWTVRKVAQPSNSYRRKGEPKQELFAIREHKGGSKLTLRIEGEWGSESVDEHTADTLVPVIKSFTRNAPTREEIA